MRLKIDFQIEIPGRTAPACRARAPSALARQADLLPLIDALGNAHIERAFLPAQAAVGAGFGGLQGDGTGDAVIGVFGGDRNAGMNVFTTLAEIGPGALLPPA